MKTIFQARKSLLVLAALTVAGVLSSENSAQAGDNHRSHSHYSGRVHGHPSYYANQRSGPIYHAPSVHYHSQYHHEYSHWTPYRGWHSHGHYDAVPHYTPGHFDYKHGNHIHGNPYFH